MTPEVIAALKAHAHREAPRECCGIVVQSADGYPLYVPCRNVAAGEGQFIMHPDDYVSVVDNHEVLAICHSHVYQQPTPSQADRVACEHSGVPWIIVGHPNGAVHQFSPEGYKAPYLGRVFAHGVLDCYTLVRDYYERELGIALPDFARDDDWWLHGGNLYVENFSKAGFVAVNAEGLRKHDVVLMQVRSTVPNHAAICEDGVTILQHLMNRPSSRDVYGGWFRKCTTHVLRHTSLL